MKTQIFEYSGSKITFNTGDSVMVNATEMAKPFGKNVAEWRRLPSTVKFLTAIELTKGKSHSLIQAVEGRNGGTWMHEDVAIEFARWLSPEFSIWCNDRIKELMRHGLTAVDDLINNPDLAIKAFTALKEERRRNSQLVEENKLKTFQLIEQNRQIRTQAPKVAFAEAVACNPGSLLVREYAKTLCGKGRSIGEKRLFSWLRKNRYLNSKNEAYQKYVDQGLFELIQYPISTPAGQRFSITSKITGKGQLYFESKLFPQHQLSM